MSSEDDFANACDRRETHVSIVTLSQRSAYKRLKPVRFDFLDFSTREARYVHLANELRRNRRLAPDVYRRLVPLWTDVNDLSFNGTGPPDDWQLKMRRLPEEATLEAALLSGRLTTGEIDRVLDLLVPFFRSAGRSEEINANGDPAVVRTNLVENLDVLDEAAARGAFDEPNSRRLRSLQLQAIERHDIELRSRVSAGWIRDGHGDLRAEHIYLTHSVRIIDCIAFNHRLCWIDTADDLSFLATDLIRFGGIMWAKHLVAEYRRRMNDPASDGILAFYRSYRFAVRAKVAILRGRGQTGESAATSATAAQRFANFAIAELDDLRPWLVAICGLSGTGKSTVARALAKRIGARSLSSDPIRKEIHGLAPTERADPHALYSDAATDRTYFELLARAASLIAEGTSVVLDATFLQPKHRRAVSALADRFALRPMFVECRCDDAEVERRLAERSSRGGDASDATPEVWRRQRSISHGYSDLPTSDHLVVRTTDPATRISHEIVSRLIGR